MRKSGADSRHVNRVDSKNDVGFRMREVKRQAFRPERHGDDCPERGDKADRPEDFF